MTILISGIVHEYVLAVGLGFASPVLLFLFAGPGGQCNLTKLRAYNLVKELIFIAVIFMLRPSKSERLSNFFILLSLTIGTGNIFFYYQAEIAARLYCPQEVK
jgi:hypothetical protein